jgi:hypothetical protein
MCVRILQCAYTYPLSHHAHVFIQYTLFHTHIYILTTHCTHTHIYSDYILHTHTHTRTYTHTHAFPLCITHTHSHTHTCCIHSAWFASPDPREISEHNAYTADTNSHLKVW